MNPNATGWIEVYTDSLIDNYINSSKKQLQELLYYNISETGFLYGFPSVLNLLQFDEIRNWSKHEIVKISFIETLACTYINKNSFTNLPDNFKDVFINDLYSFFTETSSNNASLKEKVKLIEKEINIKVSANGKIKDYLSVGAFQNGLLFVETIVFEKWLGNKKLHINKLKNKIISETIKVIIASAISNDIIDKKEKSLIKFYIASSGLDAKLVESYQINYKNIDEIDLTVFDSWILKKVVLELACLVVMSDNIIDDDEQDFLTELTNKLELPYEELNASIISVEHFLFANHKNVYYLNKSKIPYIGISLSNRIFKLLRKNKVMITNEIKESAELVELIRKSTMHKLTKEEKAKVNDQLIDIVKTMPAVAIFMVPGGSFLLPIILKILPEDLIYPSSFTNKNKIKSKN